MAAGSRGVGRVKAKCRRCRRRWQQEGGVCRTCRNILIAERARLAAEQPPDPIAPSYARPGGFGVTTHVPGTIALSFFGTVWNRR